MSWDLAGRPKASLIKVGQNKVAGPNRALLIISVKHKPPCILIVFNETFSDERIGANVQENNCAATVIKRNACAIT